MPTLPANTKLFLPCDGTNESTTFTDLSGRGHVVTANGNAQISTAIKKYGTGSYKSVAQGDCLSIPASYDFAFGSNNYTIAFWVYFNTFDVTAQYFFSQNNGTQSIRFYFRGTLNFLAFIWYDTEQRVKTFAWSPSIETWYHVAIVRNSNDLMTFVDGVQVGSTESITTTIQDPNSTVYIASYDVSAYYCNAYFDEFLVNNGTALWTTNFTPPTEAYSVKKSDSLLPLLRRR